MGDFSTVTIQRDDRIALAKNIIHSALQTLADDAERAEALLSISATPDARTRIERALAAMGGNITRAAVYLKCSRRALFNQMRKLGMTRGTPGRKHKIGPMPMLNK